MALLSAERPEAVTNRRRKATIFLSIGHVNGSYRLSLHGIKSHFDKQEVRSQ